MSHELTTPHSDESTEQKSPGNDTSEQMVPIALYHIIRKTLPPVDSDKVQMIAPPGFRLHSVVPVPASLSGVLGTMLYVFEGTTEAPLSAVMKGAPST